MRTAATKRPAQTTTVAIRAGIRHREGMTGMVRSRGGPREPSTRLQDIAGTASLLATIQRRAWVDCLATAAANAVPPAAEAAWA